ncbi:3-hydroxyacyl-CoA dehydrogenase family protein [Melioribacteraceae bacterium 4301-Me]|uniref:3-hydroxyacyl-CoA dehydrogenase family protein n=1 Tax=Pyranulibacter aquaticus TaxID=3163344 RepID=UPI0035958EE8
MKKVAVIGAGTMGNGIAHVFALNGYSVQLIDMSNSLLQNALNIIQNNLDRQLNKNIITESQKKATLNNITPVIGLENILNDTELIIEAIYENKEAKLQVFKKLEEIVDKNSIFASNTSSISITELSSVCRAEKFIGMHFMNPVPVMKLVEIIRGYSTSEETFQTIKEIVIKINKQPVEVKDYPGFISNRVLMPMINEAIFALYEGVASIEDIDTVMKLGMNHPMGPLTLADFIGLDVCLNIMEVLYNGFNDSKYRPCPLLKKMVAAGKLGRKSGEGFYKYK